MVSHIFEGVFENFFAVVESSISNGIQEAFNAPSLWKDISDSKATTLWAPNSGSHFLLY